jgi:hypothetical protein
MGKININDLDRYEENHQPFEKKRKRKKKQPEDSNQQDKVKHK